MKRIGLIALLVASGIAGMAQVVTKEKALAAGVMDAMGGYERFQQARYLQWDFFGYRTVTWDKWNKQVRIDYPDGSLTIITKLDQLEGKVYRHGEQLTDKDSLNIYLEQGQRIWMNDSYWLVMPFKLFDPGVQLSYLGRGKDMNGNEAEMIELTFQEVGATPENRYVIYIDPGTYLITQWDYHVKHWEEEPEISCTWTGYEWYSGLRFASERSGFGTLTNIKVMTAVPASTFSGL